MSPSTNRRADSVILLPVRRVLSHGLDLSRCQASSGKSPNMTDLMVLKGTEIGSLPFALGDIEPLAIFVREAKMGLQVDAQPLLLIFLDGQFARLPPLIESPKRRLWQRGARLIFKLGDRVRSRAELGRQ
jgi:hypothetical protein